jgi:hypothetical protein
VIGELVGLEESSEQFLQLLLAGFATCGNSQLLWKAASISPALDSLKMAGNEILSENRPGLTVELIGALERDSRNLLSFLLELDLLSIRLPDTIPGNLGDTAVAFLMALGVHNADPIRLFAESDSAPIHEFAFDRHQSSSQSLAPELIKRALVLACKSDRFSLVAKLPLALLSNAELVDAIPISEPRVASFLVDLVAEPSALFPILCTKHFPLVAKLFSNSEIFDGFCSLIESCAFTDDFGE